MSNQCFKRQVCAVIIDKNGQIAAGENLIYNMDVTECPRLKGEGYEKCISICKQKGHAETEAIKNAKARGMILKGANIYLLGHYKACDNCKAACEKEGLNIVIVDEEIK